MVARVITVAFQGVEARRVDVEVQLTGGEGAIVVVGLGDKAVSESRERVRGAFAGLGLAMPGKRVVVNLAPADLPKEGSHYDLPIALAIMGAMGVIPPDSLNGWCAVGELSLDGRIVPVAGALPAAAAISSARLAFSWPLTSRRSANPSGSSTGPGEGWPITCVLRKWLTRLISERGARMAASPAHAASGPQASGQIRPSPIALAATAAGSAPATGMIRPSSDSSPTAHQPFRLSGGMTPMAPMMASAMGRS